MVHREKDGGVCFPLVSNFLRTSHPYYTVETFKHNPPTYASSVLLQEHPASCVLDTVYWEQEAPAFPSSEAVLASLCTAPMTPRGEREADHIAPKKQCTFLPTP